MASVHNLITTEAHGSQGLGVPFDDCPSTQKLPSAAISRLVIGHADYIYSLTVHYVGNISGVKHGTGTGKVDEVVLESNEFITKIEGNICYNVFSKIFFTSNNGRRWGPFGSCMNLSGTFVWNGATGASADLAPRMGLLYFSGEADEYIRFLKATFAPYPRRGTTPKVVKYEEKDTPELDPPISGVYSKFTKKIMSSIVTLLVGPDNIEFYVYQEILCTLPFFRAALQGGFREASEKKIVMPEDEPETVSALIEFLYTGSYTYTYTPKETADIPASDLIEGSFHVAVYAIASKYDCQSLVKGAVGSFTHVLKALAGIEVVRLWKVAYSKGLFLSDWEGSEYQHDFTHGLSALLKQLYVSHRTEMESIISDYPALASDLIRLLVSA